MQRDADSGITVDLSSDVTGEGGQHGPGERTPFGQPAGGRCHGHADHHRVRRQLEGTRQVAARHSVRDEHRACFIDRDPKVLDLVQIEVEACGETAVAVAGQQEAPGPVPDLADSRSPASRRNDPASHRLRSRILPGKYPRRCSSRLVSKIFESLDHRAASGPRGIDPALRRRRFLLVGGIDQSFTAVLSKVSACSSRSRAPTVVLQVARCSLMISARVRYTGRRCLDSP